jgi:hypothetical protein
VVYCCVLPCKCTSDAKVAVRFRDPEPLDNKMLMASASADFDNNWKDETVTLFGYEGGPLHAAFTYISDDYFKPLTLVVRVSFLYVFSLSLFSLSLCDVMLPPPPPPWWMEDCY